MMSLHSLPFFLWATLLHGCSAILQVKPAADDLADRNEYFHTNYYSPPYIAAKRSFIYPQYDVERFALVPETARDEKRNFIKGPSIEPVIEDEEHLDIGNVGVQDNGAFKTPQVEMEENPRKFSEIAREGKLYQKKKQKKITQKEKEALSAGLIKLLYDWKMHQKHTSSGSGSKGSLKIMRTNGESLEGNTQVDGEKKHASIRSSKALSTDQRNPSETLTSNTADVEQDPLVESKRGQNFMAVAKKEKQNEDLTMDTTPEVEEGSAEFTRRKSKGKINVLVNVNINERSIRSKVSHANKIKQSKKILESQINFDTKSGENEEDEDSSGEEEDYRYGEDEISENSSANDSSPAMQTYENDAISRETSAKLNSNTSALTGYQQSHNALKKYGAMEDDQKSNFLTATISTTNARKTPGTNLISRQMEDDASGDDEYDSFEEKINEEEASGFSGNAESKEAMGQQKPKRILMLERKQINAKVYLRGAKEPMSKDHGKKKSRNEAKGLKPHVEKTVGQVTYNENYNSVQKEANTLSVDKPKKHSHRGIGKAKKLIAIDNDKRKDETFLQEGTSTEKSTATPKFSKPKDNPKIVTKSSDSIGKVARPDEATSKSLESKELTKETENFGSDVVSSNIETQKLEKYGRNKKLSSRKHPDVTETLFDKKEEFHLVKLHDSEIKLLKDHRAKIQSSEPIVIDDIKKKHKKPKQNPKEATKWTEKDGENDQNMKQNLRTSEDSVNVKPTTKRSFVTPQKPEEVLPLTEAHLEKGKSVKQTAKDKVHAIGETGKSKNEADGSGDDEPKKYGSLKSVRERFKAWEKEMISRLSNPFLGKDMQEYGSGEEKVQDKSYKSWKDEEQDLISKLSNPFLHPEKLSSNANLSPKVQEKKKEDKKIISYGGVKGGNNAHEPKHNTLENGDIIKDNLSSTIKDEKSTATPEGKKPAEIPVKTDIEELKSQNIEKVGPTKNLMQSFVPEADKKLDKTKKLLSEKAVDMKELEKFRQQIINEVGKIDKLEEEYKKNTLKSKELKGAKETLTKDLQYIKDIEKKLAGNLVMSDNEKEHDAKEHNEKEHDEKEHNEKEHDEKEHDEKEYNEKEHNEKEHNEKEHDEKGHDEKEHDEKDKVTDLKFHSKEKSFNTGNFKEKEDPLLKIQGLLQAEMMRSKDKTKSHDDKQLENIRGLLKQELKKLIKSGKLGSLDHLPSGLKKLGKMIHQKLKTAKKKKNRKKKINKKKKQKKHGKELKNSLEFVKEHKPTEAGSIRGHITTMSKYKAAMNALKTLKEQQELASLHPIGNSTNNSTQPTKPHVVMPNNLPTGAQAQQFKDLLKNLNKKIGEVYSKLQSTTQRQQPNNFGNNQQMMPNEMMNPGNSFNAQPTNTAFNPIQQPQGHNVAPQSAPPITNSFSNPQMKHNLPIEPEEPKEELEPDTVLAEAEPVETLIENLEKDITDVWSFREQYPDAVSLGLDNDKIHKAYANLGSLSGLNLRRSLERALRGKDVGLVIVGGSISKGGPFSEKGVDYALKTYFYAIADWWNKAIRPITGSGMVIRDVSIGGIATDYYSYCLRSHIPNDRLNNIVLWELSANDMHRFDDGLRPKQQLLEQFTQEVLSLKAKPALIFLNFFALFSWDQDLLTHCRNFEDEGEDDIAKHYKITSLSWRDMVCSLMQENKPLFTRDELFSEDQFHPSIEAHAQMAYVIIDYIRTEFLKNLVKQRFLEIGDAARKLKIPETVYIPKPMYKQTFTWKPLCYTYMIVDGKEPNNTLSVKEEVNGDFHYTILREFKVRSDKIVGMETKKNDQFITYDISVPLHRNGEATPYKSLVIMSFTDNRQAEVRFDSSPVQKIDTEKKFLEGTVLKYIATNVTPGSHKLTIRSGPDGFIISAIMLG